MTWKCTTGCQALVGREVWLNKHQFEIVDKHYCTNPATHEYETLLTGESNSPSFSVRLYFCDIHYHEVVHGGIELQGQSS